MMPSPGLSYFSEDAVRNWRRIADRHRLRDALFLRKVETFLRPGSTLEIGAATGQLTEILNRRGYDITASDVSPPLVAAIAARGVPAMHIDATADIRTLTGRRFANVLAQNVLPLIKRDRNTVVRTLAAIHGALEANGRLICISAHPWRDRNPQSYFRPREQIGIATASGLFRLVTVFPHQVVPTALYRSWNARILNFLDFHVARIAAVRLVWVMEKIE
jgi:SAM-dependent methyltransferase